MTTLPHVQDSSLYPDEAEGLEDAHGRTIRRIIGHLHERFNRKPEVPKLLSPKDFDRFHNPPERVKYDFKPTIIKSEPIRFTPATLEEIDKYDLCSEYGYDEMGIEKSGY